MNKKKQLVLVLLIIFGGVFGIVSKINQPVQASEMGVSTAWTYNFETYGNLIYISSPAIADLDGDGNYEVIVAGLVSIVMGNIGVIMCLDMSGELLWSYATYAEASGFFSSPTIADIDGDGFFEILIGGDQLYCISHTGDLLWGFYTSYSNIFSSPAIVDLDGDGFSEILFVSKNNSYTGPGYSDDLYCLDANGTKKWTSNLGSYNLSRYFIFKSSPSIADLDRDGTFEIIIGSFDNKTYCFSHTGELEWSYQTNGIISSTPAIANLDGDDNLEILFTSENRSYTTYSHSDTLYCLNSNGSLKWTSDLGSYTCNFLFMLRSSPSVADLDQDGTFEIVIGSYNNNTYCFSHIGDLEWVYETDGGITSAAGIVDLDGDDTLEVVIGSDDSNLYCLSHSGVVDWSYQSDSPIRGSPAIVDLDNNDKSEIIFCSNKIIYCLIVTGIEKSGSSSWWCFGGSPMHTGHMDSDENMIDDLTDGFYDLDSSETSEDETSETSEDETSETSEGETSEYVIPFNSFYIGLIALFGIIISRRIKRKERSQ